MPGPWLLTRPRPDAERDGAALRGLGVEAQPFPLLERAPLPWIAAPGADLVLLTSASVLPSLLSAWPSGRPLRVAALGPVTAARARQAGLAVDLEAEGGAEALVAAVLEAWQALGAPARVLWPTSAEGLRRPEQERAAAALQPHTRLERVAVISVKPASNLNALLADAPVAARWVLASPSAALALPAPRLPIPAAVLCVGGSTARAWAERAPAHWPDPLCSLPGQSVVEAVLHHDSLARNAR